jgi:xylulokinase
MTGGEQHILAIDLGTSGPKAVVVARDGSIISSGYTPVDTLLLPGGGAEQDPEQIWSAVVSSCRQALSSAASPNVIGITVCSQYSSIVPVDEHGSPTMNMVLWMDKRGAPGALGQYPGGRRLQNTLLRKLLWVRIHGIPPLDSGNDSLAHMRFIRLAKPEVYERTRWFLEPMDFVTFRLTGTAAANPCSAFLMLLVDNRHLDEPRYHPALIRHSGIDTDKLPPLVPSDAGIGCLSPGAAAAIGLSTDVKVWTGVNDTQAGGMGCYAFSGSHAGLSIGTTSVVVTHVPFKRTDFRNSLVSMPSPVPGTNFVMAENGISGRAVEHFLEKIVFCADSLGDHSLEEKFEVLDRAVVNVQPGSGGLLFLPWLNGSFAPSEDPLVRGGFINMSLESTREQLARAVLEGVAFNLRWLLDAVEGFTKRSMSHLVFYGGGALSDSWSRIICDVLQKPVHQLAEPRMAVCRGLGLLGLKRHDLIQYGDFENLTPTRAIFEPSRELSARYDRMFDQFVKVFKANRKIFHALNG